MKRPVRIPTILAIVFVVFLIGGLTFATQKFLKQPIEAQGSKIPKDVKLTNITDTSFTATWKTDKPTRGIIQIKEDKGGTLIPFFDERYSAGNTSGFLMHSVRVANVKPNTLYKIYILEQNESIKEQYSYQVTTAPTLELTSNNLGPAYGSVVTGQNTPAEGAIVYLSSGQSQILSTVVKPSGSFIIPINLLRSEDLQTFVPINGKTDITITAVYDGQIATAVTDTSNDSPIPEIVLGKTYDFRNQQSKRKTTEEEKPVAIGKTAFENVLGSQVTAVTNKNWAVQFLTPSQGANVTSPYPFVTGLGVPNMFVTITLGGTKPYTASTKVNTDGSFQYQPAKPLGIGKQSITITTVDQNKKPVAITHLIEVLKSGTQVLGAATPSATPIITLVPTESPITITDTPIATATPITATTLPTTILAILGFSIIALGIAVLAL
jgi:hypothetical protein